MNVNLNKTYTPEKVIAAVVRAISYAIDDVIADFAENEFVTSNSYPTRVWEYINRDLVRELPLEMCKVIKTHRGPWEFMIIYDKQTGNIMTIMRTQRFTELRKSIDKRETEHYLQLLARSFNSELSAEWEQIGLEPIEDKDVDMKIVEEEVQKLLSNLTGENEPIKNHVLILFDTASGHLVNVKSVMVTPKLEIVAGSECDLSRYIPVMESVIVDKVTEPESVFDKPERGLKLKNKAVERQSKRNNRIKTEVTEAESNG